MKYSPENLDFDALKALAETDPDAFEAYRCDLIEQEIRKSPQDMQRRLRGLQWQIDVVRKRYKHPLVSAQKLFEMMWQRVYGTGGLYEALTVRPSPAVVPSETVSDNVVRFRRSQGFNG